MFWKHLEIYIGYGLLIALIYESQVIVGIIHLVSSFLWWSITFVVVAIIRPANRSGVLSVILPQVQKVVIAVSTVSIISGFVLFGIHTNYQFYELFLTSWGNLIFVSGILSLIVYCNVVSGGKIGSMIIKLKKLPKLANQVPIMFFSMITITLTFMILISKVYVTR